VSRLSTKRESEIQGLRITAAIVLATASAFVFIVPWRCVTKYYRYREVGADVRSLAAEKGFDGGLVFVRAVYRSDYQSAFNFNAAGLDGPGPVYAQDMGDEHRNRVVAAFPNRPIWVIGRPPDNSPRLVVLAGPLTPGISPKLAPYDSEQPLQANLP
jgi:hypothetical protein